MRRIGWKLAVLILLALLVFVWLVKAPILSSYLSDKMRIPVSIARISLWPSHASIHNFRIKNPSRFKNNYALTAENTQISYQFGNLFNDPIVIDEILVDGINLKVECLNGVCSKNNWTEIGSKMPKQTANRELIIHKLVLTNINAEITGLSLVKSGRLSRRVDRLEFHEIDSKTGFPTEDLIREIFGKAGLQEYIKEMFSPENIIKKIRPLNIFGTEADVIK